jgi:exodeoxyribonuclease VII small subunit
MSDDPEAETEEIGFSAAMQELEAILGRIESEEVDIDQLAEELGRAAELLELCRGRIRKAEVEVSQIVQSLETASPSDAAGQATDEEEG